MNKRKSLSEVKAVADFIDSPSEPSLSEASHNSPETTLVSRERRQQYTIRMVPNVYHRLKACAEYTPGKNLTDLLETAVREYIDRREQEHGGPFTIQ